MKLLLSPPRTRERKILFTNLGRLQKRSILYKSKRYTPSKLNKRKAVRKNQEIKKRTNPRPI
ncbi:MAG: hypothetical protein LBR79_04865, partial [Oscillospiraceae bacterium]|nr:hypothetical protein [Oscillospiraceae bacterium]